MSTVTGRQSDIAAHLERIGFPIRDEAGCYSGIPEVFTSDRVPAGTVLLLSPEAAEWLRRVEKQAMGETRYAAHLRLQKLAGDAQAACVMAHRDRYDHQDAWAARSAPSV